MNYGLLKMKSILFNSKCGDADSCEQYGGDDSDQQKEQDHFSSGMFRSGRRIRKSFIVRWSCCPKKS